MQVKILDSGARIGYSINNENFVNIKFLFITEKEHELDDLKSVFRKSHIVEHLVADYNLEDFEKVSDKILTFSAMTYNFHTEFNMKCKKEDFCDIFDFMLKNTFNRTFNQTTVNRELDIIEIESKVSSLDYIASYNYTFFDSKILLDQHKQTKQELNDASSMFNSQELRDIKTKNSSADVLQKFYDENYVPERFIMGLQNISKEQLDYATKQAEQHFSHLPKKSPEYLIIKTLSEEGEEGLAVPEGTYFVEPIYGDVSGIAYLNIFIPTYHYNNKNNLIGDLFAHLISKRGSHNFLNLDYQFARLKRGASYSSHTQILDDDKVCYINTHYKTHSKYVRKLLSSYKNMLLKIANNQIFNKEVFEKLKKDFIRAQENNSLLDADAYFEDFTQSLIMPIKHFSIEDLKEKIEKIRYDDFMKYAKYAAYNNDFKISCTGNNISYDDLTSYQTKQKSKQERQRLPELMHNKTDLKKRINTQDFNI